MSMQQRLAVTTIVSFLMRKTLVCIAMQMDSEQYQRLDSMTMQILYVDRLRLHRGLVR